MVTIKFIGGVLNFPLLFWKSYRYFNNLVSDLRTTYVPLFVTLKRDYFPSLLDLLHINTLLSYLLMPVQRC